MDRHDIQMLRLAVMQEQKTIPEVALKFKCCEATIRKYLTNPDPHQRMNMAEYKEALRMLKETQSLSQSAKRVGLSKNSLKAQLVTAAAEVLAETGYDVTADNRVKKRFNNQQLKEMLDLYAGGMTQPELAKWHNLSESRISFLLKKARSL